jgi:hypothetical protein
LALKTIHSNTHLVILNEWFSGFYQKTTEITHNDHFNMKKFSRTLAYIFGGVLLVLLVIYIYFYFKWRRETTDNTALPGDPAPTLTIDGRQFRDLNKNGKLDIYEDFRVDV